MAEGARLESVYTLIAYRGFESLSLRQIPKPRDAGLFVSVGPHGDEPLSHGGQGFDKFADQEKTVYRILMPTGYFLEEQL